jgi:putative ABC transport system permease protein
MKRLLNEFVESFRIGFTQIRANKMRSALTALGVIIGIVAVTLMGTAIKGIDKGFENSLAMLGDDILYVQKWPWSGVEDWWNYANRPEPHPREAVALNRVIQSTQDSQLSFAVPVAGRMSTVKVNDSKLNGVYIIGTTAEWAQLSAAEYREGRLFNDVESATARQVCTLGSDVADALFPGRSPVGDKVSINGQPYEVVGVLAKQGEFLGLFSFDNVAVIPLPAFQKYNNVRRGAELRVKIKDKTKLNEAREELVGAMRRVRGQLPGERDNFTINESQAFKAQLDPLKSGIAIVGLFITGLSLFVGAIGIMNITFVSVKERTKEIGTRKALGARRRSILLQFLIEAVSICMIGGLTGLAITFLMVQGASAAFPALPVQFPVMLIFAAMALSVAVGVLSGFIPAWLASRLDPVVALRYE